MYPVRASSRGRCRVALKANHRLAIQCKMYAKPVGLKAVQEIAAGRSHEEATTAVVSNQRYTTAASQLASSSDVLLLHHDDLRRVDELLNITVRLSVKGVTSADGIPK